MTTTMTMTGTAPPSPGNPWLHRLSFAAELLVSAWVLWSFWQRFQHAVGPWQADADQRQAVWQYWRYTIDGAFPPGDFLTEYAFVMHAPPVWWAFMASLSALSTPLFAAKVLNVVAYFAGPLFLYLVVRSRGNRFLALAAVFLMLRHADYWQIIAGGYARSFGPMLVLLFLWTWLKRWHTASLAVLVFQAAFYPSVVIPCGLTYGAYTVLAGPTMRERLRRMAGMTVAGILIILFGLWQEVQAPDSWGHVVSEEEAIEMPAWGPGGRINEAPLRRWQGEVKMNLTRAWRQAGTEMPPSPALRRLNGQLDGWLLDGLLPAAVVGAVALRAFRRRKGVTGGDDDERVPTFPWELVALGLGAFAAYFLARHLAFRLYLPYRALSHVVPYLMYAGVPLALGEVFARLLPRRHVVAPVLAVVIAVVPVSLIAGVRPEQQAPTFVSYATHRKVFEWVRKQPLDVRFSGEMGFCDMLPLFAWHGCPVNKVLAHPFRKGFYAEAEKRLIATYEAMYAARLEDALAYMDAADVDILIVNTRDFDKMDARLFEPVRGHMRKVWTENKKKGFAFANVPASAVVLRHQGRIFVDRERLRQALAVAPTAAPPAPADADEGPGEDVVEHEPDDSAEEERP